MWTARIVLLALMLLLFGGWFDAALPKWKKRALLVFLPVVFGVTFVPTLRTPSVRLCFAPCAFALFAAILCPTEQPFAALAAMGLGGTVGWKLCDALPLFPEQGLLVALPTLVIARLYCRDGNAKALAVAGAPFVMLLLRMIGDFILFKSAVLELGTEDALAAQAIGSALLLIGGAVALRLQTVRGRLRAA